MRKHILDDTSAEEHKKGPGLGKRQTERHEEKIDITVPGII